MANTNSPFGFRPIKMRNGAPYKGDVMPYYIPSTDSNAMYKGDLVDVAGSSNSSAINGFKAGTLPTIALATVGATNRILGAIVGFERPSSITDSLSTNYRVASTDAIAYVVLANDVIFEAQNDEDMEAGDASSNVNFSAGSGGSTTSGYSSHQIDSSTITQDATYQLFVHRLVNRENNELGDYAIAEVSVNLPRVSPDTVGI